MEGDRLLALIQGGYFVITGLWPVFSRRTFEAITGPKVDWWLVQMVGLLAAAIGAPLLYGWQVGVESQMRMVALLAAVAFITIDMVYVAKKRIRWVYLLDAGVEVVFIVGWLLIGISR